MIKNSKQKGFTMLELVMYVGGLLTIGAVTIVMIVQFMGIYRELISIPRADRTGMILVDRITREIRSASSINTTDSIFNTPEGEIVFLRSEGGNETEQRFYTNSDGVVMYQVGNNTPERLTPGGLYVSNFNFAFVPTDVSQGVRFRLEIQFDTRDGIQTKSYSGFAILRESYD